MARALFVFLFAAVFAITPLQRSFAATDDEVAARKAVLDLAGAFSNDGFKLRDGNFLGAIAPKQNLLVQVNLYAGNQYWFSVAATGPAKKLAIAVFDEPGNPGQTEPHEGEAKPPAAFAR